MVRRAVRAVVDNIHQILTYDDGIFVRWLGNTLLYVVAGAGGATVLATLAGYGLAKYDFPGKRGVFAVVLGAVAVPGTALAVPTFLLFSDLDLTNTPWAVILPSLVSPFGLYLIWVFAPRRSPTELLEAARIDGAGEFRTFFPISLPAAGPRHRHGAAVHRGRDLEQLLPAADHAEHAELVPADRRPERLEPAVVHGGRPARLQPRDHRLAAHRHPDHGRLPALQRYWRSGLAAGSVKQ